MGQPGLPPLPLLPPPPPLPWPPLLLLLAGLASLLLPESTAVGKGLARAAGRGGCEGARLALGDPGLGEPQV